MAWEIISNLWAKIELQSYFDFAWITEIKDWSNYLSERGWPDTNNRIEWGIFNYLNFNGSIIKKKI